MFRHGSPRVGVIGGGQLAWMLGLAAQSLGYDLWVQTPKSSDPAVAIATGTILAPIADATATAQLAKHCDVITFENEFVNLPQLQHLADQGVNFAPRLETLAPLLDKYDQRCYLQSIGLPTPKFCLLTQAHTGDFNNPWGFPVVLKARRQGYDGRGTCILETPEALNHALENQNPEDFLLEEFIPFDRELAVMIARSPSGEISLYPVVETQQENQVCHRVIAPAPISEPLKRSVQQFAQTFIEQLNGVGIFGLEFFLTPDDRILVNEVAPRTHNSGHYTIEGCHTSQFAQQLRAVLNLPLGSSDLKHRSAVMINLLGYESATCNYVEQRQKLAQIPHSTLHWYGKTQAHPGRKLGHITIVSDQDSDRLDVSALQDQVMKVWQAFH
jgi:5-(carboxyamino)imidazole ribonucleotide synthase